MRHTINGEQVPDTRSTHDVLIQLEALAAKGAELRPPDLVRLLWTGGLRYQREARGLDAYLTWDQVLETSSPVKAWVGKLGGWGAVCGQWAAHHQALERLLQTAPAVADCEDLTAFAVASLPSWGYARQGWVAVQEVGMWGTLAGWHAVPFFAGSRPLPARVPPGANVYVLDRGRLTLKAGEQWRLMDPSWLGGMQRPDLGEQGDARAARQWS